MTETDYPKLPSGNVYVLQDFEDTPYKFGYATNVADRVASLQTANWRPLRVIAAFPADQSLESSIHRLLKHENVQLEWFMGPDTDRVLKEIREILDFMDRPENRYVNPAVFTRHLLCPRGGGSAVLTAALKKGRERRESSNVVHPDRGIDPSPVDRQPASKTEFRTRRIDTVVAADGDVPWSGRPSWMDEAA